MVPFQSQWQYDHLIFISIKKFLENRYTSSADLQKPAVINLK